ncbi:MAG: DUF763 domain-containing protein [Candidatus Thermoplasmatota archaeon]|nr:DUF763 domain-containing protein [Candidatus Thermoplasmatota archaeon]
MEKTGTASLPLHPGKAPRWLFGRMVKLAKAISGVMIYEYGHKRFLQTISDPFWFQAFSCVLGFDWHSSGTTTVTCGALKEALTADEGMRIAGGKGKSSKKTLEEIEIIGKEMGLRGDAVDTLKYSSRMAAKVDNAALQDGYKLYHHAIIISEDGDWAVIQQGMNVDSRYARRYHWLSDNVKSFVEEPHDAILGRGGEVMDMTARESKDARDISVDLVNDDPRHLKREWELLKKPSWQTTLDGWKGMKNPHLEMPRRINWNVMKGMYEFQPKNYEEMLSTKGVGPATVRALAFISELMYGSPPSWKDPIKYSFAVGGKDGIPYPVNRKAMDEATSLIREGINEAKIGNEEKLRTVKRLKKILPQPL